ncbi:Ribulose-5-phosphate 4-epimerase/Fuculose-1-phosphate aldolase [Bradyrhizobium brasilense]|uniref:Ribulose-5-phosphate 4-epimerase/Fuculose-1-phosphate aldolase n=1 Tax=Bradyrhizobium brasilense TaxID=1419277 RepID=A0A1G6TTN4_9BRAD|nr:class II aldolase/adducin family protein [Bradyrhizobium brasilense]SDD32440.1 Ribulose-5-phosphate 4-epimerase/Fuculose-1-phosphate aldolase [Bradyrhizobium brasilense]
MSNDASQEWEIRCDLAAAYRLIAHFGMDDLISAHLSARLPGKTHRFLLNPYGMMFDEITASSLVVVDPEGHAIQKEDEAKVNNAGFTIHSAVHMGRDDAQCVIHTHTVAGMAVAAQEQGLLPLNQKSMCLYGGIAYHDYEGVALDLNERERLVRDLGDKDLMVLKHHGLLTIGRTVSEAFLNMYLLEQSCRVQIAATQGGQKLALPSDKIATHTADQFQREGYNRSQRPWPALKRRLDRVSSGYAT